MKVAKSTSNGAIINLITGIVTMIVQLTVNFFLSPYIVKTLGEAANGFTQLANNFVAYASLLTLAFNSMAGRFVSVNYHRGEIKKAKQYYSSVVICNLAIIMLILPLSVIIVLQLDKLIMLGDANAIDVKVLFLCVFLNFAVNQLITLYSMAMFVQNKIYLQNILNLARNFANALLLLCVFSIFPPKMYFVTSITLILTIVSLPIYVVIKKRILPIIRFDRKLFNWSAVFELFKAGIWNTVNQCGNMLMTGMDLLLANLFIGPEEMGILSVAKTIPNAVIILAGVINTSFAPELTIDWATGSKETLLYRLRRSIKISAIIVSIPVITFCVFSVNFYRLWQPTLNAQTLSQLSILTMASLIPFSGIQALYNVFSATNRLKYNSITFLACGLLNIAIVFVLLKTTSWSVYAVAGVSVALTILRTLFFVIPYTARIFEIKWFTFYKDVLLSIFISGICFASAMLVKIIVKPNGWISLIGSILISALVSFVVDLFIILSKKERNMILQKIRRKK